MCEVLKTADLILDDFPKIYRDCALLSLQLVKLHSEMPGHILFSGRIRSGDNTAKGMGILKPQSEYTVYWNPAQDKGGQWYTGTRTG